MRALQATINLAALRHNFAVAKRCAPGRSIFAVVKANAYGHGVREVVTALHDDAEGFAVSNLHEAAEVRALHGTARILLLHGCATLDEYRFAAQLQLDVLVHSAQQAEQLLAADLSPALRIWLCCTLGVYGLGLDHAAVRAWHGRLQQAPQVAELNLLGQLAGAARRDHELLEEQLEDFSDLLDLDFNARSLADSAALLTVPASHMDWLRPGSLLYGLTPFADLTAAQLGLRAVMSLHGQLLAVRDVPAGASVGADGSWQATRPSRIGIVNCGYADGYPRQARSGTPVLVDGRRVPLVATVGLDLLYVDLTDLPEVGAGAEVELWGENLCIDEVARCAASVATELVTQLSGRVARRYRYA
ncbi:alanine racemase [Pseudomonas sp. 5P_3.1_Bac2]|uniref:alanine racemase n=1 Tax=Pseudomonas sp. 5P_3.1_Bac2 TaxID=2971617 RepID=UPI0021C854E6|nr:alanine racemase [Pseudomonas sp. 5P_3.1_Bac2]MCU1718277.1 alanine racemase [Pseudomonas sp. 5P_3.1_Bac2]